MKNIKDSFYGQQEGEEILHVISPHNISIIFGLIKLCLASATILFVGFIIQNQLPGIKTSISAYTTLVGILLGVAGTFALISMNKKTISYLTTRRVVRFLAHTPFATSVRSLTWDQAVKAKTLPPNFIYKMWMIGDITIHAKSTVSAIDTKTTHNIITNDDIHLKDVYYYKDLGNYIEKIIYTFNRDPKNINKIKPFVQKPKGKRY
ncbi:hypothetical protein ACFL1M_02145 [Patescibacteria group bacterium]